MVASVASVFCENPGLGIDRSVERTRGMPDNHERATAVLLQVAENADLDASARVRACELILGRPLTLSSDEPTQQREPASKAEQRERNDARTVAMAASGGLRRRLSGQAD